MKRWPWDVDIDTTKAALERTMRALVKTDSTMTDSMTLSNTMPWGRWVMAFLRVHIPGGREGEFRELAKPYRMAPPPRIQLGCEPPVDDGHPGRERA